MDRTIERRLTVLEANVIIPPCKIPGHSQRFFFVGGDFQTRTEAEREMSAILDCPHCPEEPCFLVFNLGETKTAGSPGWEGLQGGL